MMSEHLGVDVDLAIAVLGSLRAAVDGVVLAPGRLSRREQGLVTLLALNRGAVVPTSRLIDELWPEDPPEGAGNTIQVYVSRIRRALGRDAIRTTTQGYALNVSTRHLDVAQFEELAANGAQALKGGRYAEAAGSLRQALALWDGSAPVDEAVMPSVRAEMVRLTELRSSVLEDRIEADLALGRGTELVAELQDLVEQSPFRERLQAALMTALFHAGRQAESLERYGRYRERCVDELGIDPGQALQALQASILAGGVDLTPVAAPLGRLSKTDDPTASLPPSPTPLVGRDAELADLEELLRSPTVRLVTLTGPGGSGKTRLAVELARLLSGHFADGVYFVPLASVTTGDVMWTSIAEVLNVPPEGRVPPGLFDHVAQRSALFVLDNLEQLTDADKVISELLSAATQAVVIATSRRPLHLAGEHEHPVPPLEVPEQLTLDGARSSGAVQLFVQKARMVRPAFVLTSDNSAHVVDICRRLDGLPLAIELAAARSKILSPAALLARLDTALELKDTGVDRPARQQTLKATIAWSYLLLRPELQRLWRRLGVFAGGADLEAAASVVTDEAETDQIDSCAILDLVSELLDASLVTLTESPDGEPRIGILQTIRTFAQDLLVTTGESDTVQERHAHYYVDVADSLAPTLYGEGSAVALTRFATEHDNFRAALGWATQPSLASRRAVQQSEISLRLCSALATFWDQSGYWSEGRRWPQQSVEGAAGADSRQHAETLDWLGHFLYRGGQHARARDYAISSVQMWRRLAHPAGLPGALADLVLIEVERGQTATCRPLLDEARAVAQEIGDNRQLHLALQAYASFEDAQGNYERALQLDTQAVEVARQLKDSWRVLVGQHNIACTLRELGRVQEAADQLREIIPAVLDTNAPLFLTNLAGSYAGVLADLDEHHSAALLLGAADAMRQRLGYPRTPTQKAEIAEPIAKTRAALTTAEWDDAYQAGFNTTVEDALHRIRVSGSAT